MRIAMYMPGLAPGSISWQIYQEFAWAIRQRGHLFELVTNAAEGVIRQTGDGGGVCDGEREGLGLPAWDQPPVRVLPRPKGWGRIDRWTMPVHRTRSLLSSAAMLTRFLREQPGIDLLYLELAYPCGVAARLAVLASGWQGKLVVTPMGEDILVAEEAAFGFRRFLVPRVLMQRTLVSADGIRCISPLISQTLDDLSIQTPRRLIPLTVAKQIETLSREDQDTRVRRRRAARQTIDGRYGTAGQKIILALGRVHPVKGLSRLVHSLAGLPEGLLLIAGPASVTRRFGDMAEHLKHVAETHGVGDRVQLLGPVPASETAQLLAAADVVAAPSYTEGMNRVCIEAAAAGTPFVVTDTSGISSWVPEAGVGIVVRVGDAPALTLALDKILSGGWEWSADRAAEFVEQFSLERMGDSLCAFFDDVVAGRRSATSATK
jgi:glycosyltransferase involved in cell wall biosynthesis